MNTIGVTQPYNNAMIGGESRNCLVPSGETSNTKDIWVKNKDARPLGEDLKAFASKIKTEAKETAGEIGHAVTGSDNEKMNCSIGAILLIAGAACHSLAVTAIGAGTLFLGMAEPVRMMLDPDYYPRADGASVFF